MGFLFPSCLTYLEFFTIYKIIFFGFCNFYRIEFFELDFRCYDSVSGRETLGFSDDNIGI